MYLRYRVTLTATAGMRNAREIGLQGMEERSQMALTPNVIRSKESKRERKKTRGSMTEVTYRRHMQAKFEQRKRSRGSS